MDGMYLESAGLISIAAPSVSRGSIDNLYENTGASM